MPGRYRPFMMMLPAQVILGIIPVMVWFSCLAETHAQPPKMSTILYGASYYHEYMPYEIGRASCRERV